MTLPPLLLATALLGLGVGRTDDAKEVLESLLRSVRSAELWAGTFVLERSDGTRSSASWTNFWVDLAGVRCRADIGSLEGPVALRTVIANPHEVEDFDRRHGEVAKEQSVEPYSLGHCLASCGLADPLLLLFTGRLAEDASAYTEPRCEGVEDFEGHRATRLVFSGNEECRVWVDESRALLLGLEHETEDGRVTRVRMSRFEPMTPDASSERFRLDPALPRGEWEDTHRRWASRHLRSSELWPAVGKKAPSFVGTDAKGESRPFDAPTRRTLLSFGFARDPEFVTQHGKALAERIAEEPDLDLVVVLHPTADPAADHAAFERFEALRAERVSVLRSDAESKSGAFARYRIFHCPTYFLIENGEVVAAGRRLDGLGETDGPAR